MIGSPEINKVLRRVFVPAAKQNGFTHTDARKGWAWNGPCILVYEIRAVGAYFSKVTGWPPMSLTGSIGVYYQFMPEDPPVRIKVAADGQLLPREWQCHERSHLVRAIDQDSYQQRLRNRAERSRANIWWIDPDGANVEAVVEDVRDQFLEQAMPWFRRMSDLDDFVARATALPDCHGKRVRLASIAGYQGPIAEFYSS